MQSRDRVNYQYALLHMAVLHADFGCFDEAISAINETIATARENQDMTCLNYSLSWLYYLSKAYPSKMHGAGYGGLVKSEREGISFLKAKAKEGHLWSQLSSALLSEAVLVLSKVGSLSLDFYSSAMITFLRRAKVYQRLSKVFIKALI